MMRHAIDSSRIGKAGSPVVLLQNGYKNLGHPLDFFPKSMGTKKVDLRVTRV